MENDNKKFQRDIVTYQKALKDIRERCPSSEDTEYLGIYAFNDACQILRPFKDAIKELKKDIEDSSLPGQKKDKTLDQLKQVYIDEYLSRYLFLIRARFSKDFDENFSKIFNQYLSGVLQLNRYPGFRRRYNQAKDLLLRIHNHFKDISLAKLKDLKSEDRLNLRRWVRDYSNIKEDFQKDLISSYISSREILVDILDGICSPDSYYDGTINDIIPYVNGKLPRDKFREYAMAFVDFDKANLPYDIQNYKVGRGEMSQSEKKKFNKVNESIFIDDYRYARKDIPFSGIQLEDGYHNNCKVCIIQGKVYPQAGFNKGDIVEVCPCKILDKSDMFSRNIRDLAFDISDSDDKKYAIPLGYCQYYTIEDAKVSGNCDYFYDPKIQSIVIRAICPINRRTELILKR